MKITYLEVSHLLFAYDSLFFVEASARNGKSVEEAKANQVKNNSNIERDRHSCSDSIGFITRNHDG